MPKYRKKPLVIEAEQLTQDNYDRALEFAFANSNKTQVSVGADEGGQHLVLHTLEGALRVNPGEWIILGIHGELYPCKPDIFDETYEAVEEATGLTEPGEYPVG